MASISGPGSSISAQKRSRMATVMGPASPSPIFSPSRVLIGRDAARGGDRHQFVGVVELLAGDVAQRGLDAHLVGELVDRLAGDAGQRVPRRRGELAVLDDARR